MNLLFKLSYLNSNFALTLGYINPALNNPAQFIINLHYFTFSFGVCGSLAVEPATE